MKRKRIVLLAGVLSIFVFLTGCSSNRKIVANFSEESFETEASSAQSENSKENSWSQTKDKMKSEENGEMKMKVQIRDYTFTATLEDNAAADAFSEMMKQAPVVIQMSDYSGFEKVGLLGTSLPTDNRQTTTHEGDIVLYNGNQIVIFYDSNSWSYTRLGKIDDLTGWKEALGNGDITVTFSME